MGGSSTCVTIAFVRDGVYTIRTVSNFRKMTTETWCLLPKITYYNKHLTWKVQTKAYP